MNKSRHEMAMHQHDSLCRSSNTVVHAGTHRYTQLSLEMFLKRIFRDEQFVLRRVAARLPATRSTTAIVNCA
jgi:hypothetical protein